MTSAAAVGAAREDGAEDSPPVDGERVNWFELPLRVTGAESVS
jgi:hypothetical protein